MLIDLAKSCPEMRSHGVARKKAIETPGSVGAHGEKGRQGQERGKRKRN